jgi:hypothetical protein
MEEISNRVYVNRAGTKIVSGIANIATGWMELPKNDKTNIDNHIDTFIDPIRILCSNRE